MWNIEYIFPKLAAIYGLLIETNKYDWSALTSLNMTNATKHSWANSYTFYA